MEFAEGTHEQRFSHLNVARKLQKLRHKHDGPDINKKKRNEWLRTGKK
ncbi:hypothetical protein GBP346_A0721 [Burkholderia pseudomallei MSHR346]|nr:hypothetical protein GBP346_A0721 [Burkholderia pseudomallei MSHR346]